ncbi:MULTISPECIES: S9 family peptidase [Streptosporangium]|uniref:Dipeptidyl-peptidase-4 n=1 Tax=Streptosporangium brasiliense TaxID=47480 RepID=A0ABT9RDC4_9ACTN|nr:prolyl oligopeptidase family serine peptidase [Streptosporangium brasiliense]MDP9866764.1 dipeptidyl-peptidase-4 [Streptosporangium brasiliense]
MPSDALLARFTATGRFTYGSPRALTVSPDGSRVLFLRSDGPEDPVERLWALDVATGAERPLAGPDEGPHVLPPEERALRERLRLWAPGIGSYATDGAVAVYALGGRLFRVDVATAAVEEIPAAGPAFDPRPSGDRIAYVTGGRLYVHENSGSRLIAGESHVTWGVAEFAAAEELGRHRGHWWAPDGSALLATRVDETRVPRRRLADPARPEQVTPEPAYPQAGGPNAAVELHLLGLDGTRRQVLWNDTGYPYLSAVDWSEQDRPTITVLDRLQQNGLLLAVNLATATTSSLAEFADPLWIEAVPGTPSLLADGRVLTTVEAHDTQALAVDGTVVTPSSLYVRRVAGSLGDDLLFEGSEADPAEQHVYRLKADGTPARITHGPGVHSALTGGSTVVITSGSLEAPRIRRVVYPGGLVPGSAVEIRDLSAASPYRPRPVLDRVTEHRLPSAVLYPSGHIPGERLPVLLDVYGGPGYQAIAAEPGRWIRKQWWADQGFAVVTIDNRGTPNVSASFGRAIFRRFSQVALDDQVAGLRELAGKHPDLDLSRVGVRGWSYGGYFAALAVLRRPDVFHAACAGAPPTDFRWYDTAYTERYLGLPDENPSGYDGDSLIADAPGLERPLLLIHGLADDNVYPLHTLRLSEALTRAGRPHSTLLLPGVSHMTPDGVAENLMAIELDFLRRNLPR